MTDRLARWLHDLIAWYRDDVVSSAWLRSQDRLMARIDLPGQATRWPMNQAHDHDGFLNRYLLRNREAA